MFYLFRQRKYQLLFFLMIILVSLISSCGRGISNLPIKDEKIFDQNSKLLKIVDCDRSAQAENGWNWSSLQVIQKVLVPSLENSYASERAICSLLGTYRPNWIVNYSADLIYTTTKYDKPVILSQDSVKMTDFDGTDSFSLKLVNIGKKMYVNCLNDSNGFNMFSCLLNVQYNYTSLSIRLSGNQGIGVKNIEKIINEILARLDVSIQAIDHQ